MAADVIGGVNDHVLPNLGYIPCNWVTDIIGGKEIIAVLFQLRSWGRKPISHTWQQFTEEQSNRHDRVIIKLCS